MTLSEVVKLIAILEEENKTNTEEERNSNIEHIRLLRLACEKAIERIFQKKSKK